MPRGRPKGSKNKAKVVEIEKSYDEMANPFKDKVSDFKKGDRVFITNGPEDAPDNFYGQVIFVKWSNVSGWWLDVKREDNDKRYGMPVKFAELISESIDILEAAE